MDPRFSSPYPPNHGSMGCYRHAAAGRESPGSPLDPEIYSGRFILVDYRPTGGDGRGHTRADAASDAPLYAEAGRISEMARRAPDGPGGRPRGCPGLGGGGPRLARRSLEVSTP